MSRRSILILAIASVAFLLVPTLAGAQKLTVAGAVGGGGFGASVCEDGSMIGCNDPSGVGLQLAAGLFHRIGVFDLGVRAEAFFFPMSRGVGKGDRPNEQGVMVSANFFGGLNTRFAVFELGIGPGFGYHGADDASEALLFAHTFLGYPLTSALALGVRSAVAFGVDGRIGLGLFVGAGLLWSVL